MNSKQCAKCGETADAAKAFCPACGNPLVIEETRQKMSEFDASPGTIQFGSTMHNQLLSDMGLNISEVPNKELTQAQSQASEAVPDSIPPKRAIRFSTKQIVAAGIVFLALLAVAAFVIIIALFIYIR